MDPKDKMTLYNLTEEFEVVDRMLEDNGGEFTEEIEEKMAKLLPLMRNKVDGCCGFVKSLENDIDNIELRVEELLKMRDVRKNKIKRFSEWVMFCLERTGEESFRGDTDEIKIRRSGMKLHITNEDAVPAEYLKVLQSIKVDKVGLKKAVQSGAVKIDGIGLIEGKKSVSFGIKSVSKKEKLNAKPNKLGSGDGES